MSTMAASDSIPVEDQSLLFRHIVDSSPALLHTARPDGYLDFFNETWLEFAGLPLEKLLGWEWISCIHPDDVEAFLRNMRESYARGKSFQETSRVRRADGVYRWMLHLKAPILDPAGNVIKWSGSSIDIDDRMRAEEQLLQIARESQRNEFYLAEAQRLGHIGSWVFDPAGAFQYWSPELFRIYGLDPQRNAPTLNEYLACIHPHDREFMVSLIRRMTAEASGCDVTKRIVRPDGEIRHIRCVGAPVIEDGRLLRIIGNAIDVTEQELLSRELRRRGAYLAEAQRLSHTGSFGWNPGTGEIVFSDETYRIYEINPAEQVTLDRIIEQVHPDDRALALDTAKQASSTGGAIDFTHRLLFADGRMKHLQVLAKPLDNVCDEIEFAGAVTDITEAKRAEDHLRDTRMKLGKASRLATVAELAGSIAHELNQPLMAILANAQAATRWLTADSPNVAEVNASIGRIIRDANAADATMQHIRALFRQQSFDKREVRIGDILGEVVRIVQEDPKKRSVPITCHFEEPLPAVSIDQIQIQQAFINLIVNAIEALDGQPMPLVTIRAAVSDPDRLLIQVIDNGPGVDDPERIFDAFMTTKEKGMGIGLAVSRSIVEAHGGQLWAENGDARGAIFNVSLPLTHLS